MEKYVREKTIKGFYFSMLFGCQMGIIMVLTVLSIVPTFAEVRGILILTVFRYICLVLLQHILRWNMNDRRTIDSAVKSALLTFISAGVCAMNKIEEFGIIVGCIVLGDYFLKGRTLDNRELEQLAGGQVIDFNQRKEADREKWFITAVIIFINIVIWIGNR